MNKNLIKKILIIFLIIILFEPSSVFGFSINIGKPDSFSKLAEKVGPAVVNIYTSNNIRYSSHPFGGVDQFFNEFLKRKNSNQKAKKEQNSLGSGLIISENGNILTNYHVVSGADDIFINLNDDKKLKAKIIGIDKKLDLALLKIMVPGKYPYVKFGNSHKARVGDWVMAVGNPFGLGQTITVGIISAKGRILGAGPYDDFIQTDASINPGNSGGPLFDMDGEVIGINTAIVTSGQGIGFAIPINLAKQAVDQLMSKGEVTRGWLGVSIKDINFREAEELKINRKDGVLVTDVVPKGPAYRSGLRPGDVVTKVNGDSIKSAKMMPGLVAQFAPGSEVELTIIRNDKKYKVKALLGDLDNPNKSFIYPTESQVGMLTNKQKLIGIDVRDLEKDDHESIKSGVYVSNVHKNSLAAKVGLKRGDIIRKLNNNGISGVKEFKKKLKKIDLGDILKLDVARGDKKMYFAFQR